MNVSTINETLDVLTPSNSAFKVRKQASDLEWVIRILALKGRVVEVKWSSLKGMKRTYFSIEDKVCLKLVSQRISPLGYITNMVFYRAMVMACILAGI